MDMYTRRSFLKLALTATLVGGNLKRSGWAHLRGRKFVPVSITTDGGRQSSGTFVDLEKPPAPAILIVHDHWGASASIRWIGSELGRQGFLAVIPHLFPVKFAANAEEGRAMLAQLEPERTMDLLNSWMRWLKAHFFCTGKVGILGWGESALWALQVAHDEPALASVVYYPVKGLVAAKMGHVSGNVLTHIADLPGQFNTLSPEQLKQSLSLDEQQFEFYHYQAPVGFADFLRQEFEPTSDSTAWKRTLAFYRQHLQDG
jgi:carboxymethylenebutenolidase